MWTTEHIILSISLCLDKLTGQRFLCITDDFGNIVEWNQNRAVFGDAGYDC